MFENIYGHNNIKKYLIKILKEEKFANTYLFAGPNAVGKYSIAFEFAKKILGDKFSNDIDNFIFPDLQIIFPFLKKDINSESGYIDGLRDYMINNGFPKKLKGNETISIDVIREIISFANKRPYIAKRKVIIIKNIEKMRKEGANSFLKLLEEPPENTTIILTTDNINSILPTIISRCQILRFGYLSNDNIKAYLENIKKFRDVENMLWFFDGTLANADIIENKIQINEQLILKHLFNGNAKNIIREYKKNSELYFLKVFIKMIIKLLNSFIYKKKELNPEYNNVLKNEYSIKNIYAILEEMYIIENDIKKNINAENTIMYIINLFSLYKEVNNVC